MGEDEWTEELCRTYARYMESNVPHDHRPWARRIAEDWPDLPAGATVVDVAGGPAFLLAEVAPLLRTPRLVIADVSATMVRLAGERAAGRALAVEGIVCPAEKLALPDAAADLVLCKHALRLVQDINAALREMARVLKPSGRAYLIDFEPEGAWLGRTLLELWIRLTAPPFIRAAFAETMRIGPPASSLRLRLRAAGFANASVLASGVSYLVRATKE